MKTILSFLTLRTRLEQVIPDANSMDNLEVQKKIDFEILQLIQTLNRKTVNNNPHRINLRR